MLPCPAVGATPNPLLRAPTGQKPAGAASMAIGCLAIVVLCGGIGYGALQYLPLAARRRSDRDAHLRRPGRRASAASG